MTYEFKEGEFHITLRPTLSPCHNYEEGKTVTVVLAPVAVERHGNKIVIAWACSLGPFCKFKCRYSHTKK